MRRCQNGGWVADVAMCDAGQVFGTGDAFGDDTTFGKGCHFQPETVFGDKVASSQFFLGEVSIRAGPAWKPIREGGATEEEVLVVTRTGARQVTFGDACTILADARIGNQATMGRGIVLGARSTVGLPLLVARGLAACSRAGACTTLMPPGAFHEWWFTIP